MIFNSFVITHKRLLKADIPFTIDLSKVRIHWDRHIEKCTYHIEDLSISSEEEESIRSTNLI